MRVLVTGAGGQLGLDTVAACTAAGDDVVGATRTDLDCTDRQAVLGVVTSLRSSLGGTTWYDVTLVLKNTSADTLKAPDVSVVAGRGATDELVTVPFPAPGDLGAQATWRQTVRVKLPSPVYGTVNWRATATAYGLSTTVSTTTRNQPKLLVVLAVIFALCVVALIVRLLIRLVRRVFRGRNRPGSVPVPVVAST